MATHRAARPPVETEMARALEWSRPLDERTLRHAVDYATRSAEAALQRNEASIAVRIARQLGLAQPDVAAHRTLLDRALAAQGAASDFVARNSGSSDPDTIDTLAAAHLSLGDLMAASQLWLSLARSDSSRADAFLSFAWCMVRAGNIENAEPIIEHLSRLTSHPKIDAVAMMIAMTRLDYDAALARAQKALAADPEAHVWLPLGPVFHSTGVANDASFALGMRLEDLSAILHLYEVGQHVQAGRNREAVAGADVALALVPDDRWAAMFKIMALMASEDKLGAAKAQADLAAATGARLDVLTRLVDLLFDASAHQQVVDLGRIVRERLPQHSALLSTIAHAAAHVVEMDLAAEILGSLEPLGETIVRAGLSPFMVLAMTDDPALQRIASERRARILPGPTEALDVPMPAPPAQGERLRIGYFSNDFHNHATLKLLTEALERTDRSRFEVVAYSYDAFPEDGERTRLKAAVDRFEDVNLLTETETANLIRRDGIHVLVDLKGYTGGSRLSLLKYRAAPIQVNWLGYPGTYGLDETDYIIADPFIIPPGAEGDYSEAVVRLPDCYQPNRRSRTVVETPTREMVGLPETGFVFASFNHVYKVGGTLFAAWMDILKGVPGSVLWLLSKDPVIGERLRARAEEHGVDPTRLVFGPVMDNEYHLARYGLVDLALDTFPVGSHTTASDALWMGAPLLALSGRSFVSRVSGSILRAAGMGQLVASSFDEYKAKAIAIGNDPGTARALRETLVRGRDSVPLFDPDRFAEHLGRAYEGMVEIWRRGEAPHAFDVTSVDEVPARSVEVA
jgi:predicted O-linked N-acetylglucosamine transferase (SPINDLY family)